MPPWSGMAKEVRRIAKGLNMATADKAESQEICFVPDDNYAGFVEKNRNGAALATGALIGRVLHALGTGPAAAPALAVTDALWRGMDGRVTGTAARDGLWRAQTPQGFHLGPILAALGIARMPTPGLAGTPS